MSINFYRLNKGWAWRFGGLARYLWWVMDIYVHLEVGWNDFMPQFSWRHPVNLFLSGVHCLLIASHQYVVHILDFKKSPQYMLWNIWSWGQHNKIMWLWSNNYKYYLALVQSHCLYKGACTNHVDSFFDFFYPPSPLRGQFYYIGFISKVDISWTSPPPMAVHMVCACHLIILSKWLLYPNIWKFS